MAARNHRPLITRVSAVALVAFGVFVGSLLPVAAQEEPTAQPPAVAEIPEVELVDTSIPTHVALPTGLEGATDFERFENAWQNPEFTALEAAMIAAAEDRQAAVAQPQGGERGRHGGGDVSAGFRRRAAGRGESRTQVDQAHQGFQLGQRRRAD